MVRPEDPAHPVAAGAPRRRRRTASIGLSLLALGSLAIGALAGRDDAPEPAGERDAAGRAASRLPRLSPTRLAGQRLVAGWDGRDPPRGLRRMIRAGRLAGVIVFADNIDGRRRLARTTASLQRIPRPGRLRSPLLVMADQEGGLVKRLPGPPRSSAAAMGAGGRDYARRQGAATARSLRGAGINVDLAPVLDVARDGSAIAAERRSFGGTPRRIEDVALEGFAAGLRAGGVIATAKHFPGLGAVPTSTDSASQRVDVRRARLRAVDEAPFEAFARDGGGLVMLALASYRGFGTAPAAFNPRLARRELRGRIGFAGASITDSLDADAARRFGGRRKVALAAAGAGSDLLLYGDWRDARRAGRVLSGALGRRLDRARFASSVRRVLALRSSLSR